MPYAAEVVVVDKRERTVQGRVFRGWIGTRARLRRNKPVPPVICIESHPRGRHRRHETTWPSLDRGDGLCLSFSGFPFSLMNSICRFLFSRPRICQLLQ